MITTLHKTEENKIAIWSDLNMKIDLVRILHAIQYKKLFYLLPKQFANLI